MREGYLTVGELKQAMKGLPDKTPVYYHRIEDVYFKKHGWKPTLFKSEYPDMPDEYIRAFCAFKHGKNLLITAHY